VEVLPAPNELQSRHCCSVAFLFVLGARAAFRWVLSLLPSSVGLSGSHQSHPITVSSSTRDHLVIRRLDSPLGRTTWSGTHVGSERTAKPPSLVLSCLFFQLHEVPLGVVPLSLERRSVWQRSR